MQLDTFDDGTIIIQELACRMDVAEEKLEKKQEGKKTEKISEQIYLMKTVLECTETISKELYAWFQDQSRKIEHVEETLQSQNTKLDSLVVGMDAIMKNVATAQDIQRMAASNNALVMQ
eukprot:3593219-Ditylum_brightwellii.AAC.1